ncbi:hypothetical protein [Nitratifractor sp.]
MKKGLLLSVVASTMIFAGGDIAPVEPAAPAAADFWGTIGFRYQMQDYDAANLDWGDEANNAFSAVVVLGVEKELGYGFGFGAEVAGWTDFGFDIADNAAVFAADQTNAEISQAYLTYTFGNTAIKAGRQALPEAVSPWAWSDRSAGVLDVTYDAVVIANTDLPDTTLVGAWVANAVNEDNTIQLGEDHQGIFMLAAINKSLPNTTLSASAYYAPKLSWDPSTLSYKDVWSIWAAAEGNVDSIKWGLQGVYVDGDVTGADSTFGIAGKIGSSWGDFSAQLVAAYINDGDYTMVLGTTSGFWGSAIGGFLGNTGNVNGAANTTIIRGLASYKLGTGKLYGELAYADFDSGYGDEWGARIGYRFKVMGLNANIEYRYADYSNAPGIGDDTRQRVRVEAYYKF